MDPLLRAFGVFRFSGSRQDFRAGWGGKLHSGVAMFLAGVALACGLVQAAPGADSRGKGQRADRRTVLQRASETGGWWMLVQASCDASTVQQWLHAINQALVAIGGSDLQPLVVERIEDPHLDEKSRLAMESIMQQAMKTRVQLEQMRKALAGGVTGEALAKEAQSGGWESTRPIRSAADLGLALRHTETALARMCERGTGNLRTALLDERSGLVGMLR
jgi:hypothetical protein